MDRNWLGVDGGLKSTIKVKHSILIIKRGKSEQQVLPFTPFIENGIWCQRNRSQKTPKTNESSEFLKFNFFSSMESGGQSSWFVTVNVRLKSTTKVNGAGRILIKPK